MGLIIKNGVQYIGGVESADGISFDNIKSKLNASNVQDAIDEIVSGGIGGNASEQILTQAEYDALGDEKYTDDITYYITDSEELSAHNIEFDGSKINMKVTSVQEAIEQIYNLNSDIVITLDKDEWVLDEETGLYRQDIEMDGLTGKEVPIMILTSNSDEAKAAWAKVNNPEIKEGLISFNADENIDVELTVVAKGMVTKPTNITADVSDIRNDIEAIKDRVGSVETLAAAADNKADENANVISALDDKYYTETEIDSKVDAINQAISDNTEAITKLDSDIENQKRVLLWSNPNDQEEFAPTRLDLPNLGDFGVVEIFARYHITVNRLDSIRVLIGYQGTFFNATRVDVPGRTFGISNTGIAVGEGSYTNYNGDTIINNKYFVPVKIYGYKD